MQVNVDYSTKTINEFILLFKDGQINLEPAFQRKSVWRLPDRKKLIESVFSNFPIPSIFLYKRDDNGELQYDVIDGKQRLESIFMFTSTGRFKKNRFSAPLCIGDEKIQFDYSKIIKEKPDYIANFKSYKIQTIEVSGDLSDITEIFVRINSKGKPLTKSEIRHAKYLDSDFLKEAQRLGDKYQKYFIENDIVSKNQISRMKHVEFVSELLASIIGGAPINKKQAIDKIISNKGMGKKVIYKAKTEFITTINKLKRMFPDIKTTRFIQLSDYYSLFLLIHKLIKDNFVVDNNKRNKIAKKLLNEFSKKIDDIKLRVKEGKGARKDEHIYLEYYLTVSKSTDAISNRIKRGTILENLLSSIFEKKDTKRIFSKEQRRILWHSEQRRICANTGCKKKKELTWDDFTVDHIKAFIMGGETDLTNAQLMCKECNSSLGCKKKKELTG